MSSLPATIPAKNNYPHSYDDVKSAYERCLRVEKCLMARPKLDADERLGLICVRVIGYIMHHAPTDAALATVVKQIHSCKQDDDLSAVGRLYLGVWTRTFKAAKTRTPPTPDYDFEPRPSFDTLANMIDDYSETDPPSHASAKRSALARDGFRCMVTGKYDIKSVTCNQELKDRRIGFGDTTFTRCAHILNEPTKNVDIEPGSDKREWASSMWSASRFGYTTLPDDLNGANVHRLENILTLDPTIHYLFDSFGFWFVAKDTDNWNERKNIYNIEVIPENEMLAEAYPTVTFESTRADLPLPSPEYLAIHAACCKVAHLSGASEWFREYEYDLENNPHRSLANDGTSAHLLYNALCVHAMKGGMM